MVTALLLCSFTATYISVIEISLSVAINPLDGCLSCQWLLDGVWVNTTIPVVSDFNPQNLGIDRIYKNDISLTK